MMRGPQRKRLLFSFCLTLIASLFSEIRATEVNIDGATAMNKYEAAIQGAKKDLSASMRALEELAQAENIPQNIRGACYTALAQMYEDKEAIGESEYVKAKRYYQKGASLGNETSQFRMGTLYATGALQTSQDPVKMHLHYYFAALGGSQFAQMALGYRYMFGIGVPKNCEASVLYYELAANSAIDELEREGVETLADYERLSLSARQTARFSQVNSDEDLVDYYKHSAEKGDVSAQYSLGQFYYYGIRGVERNLHLAARFFKQASSSGDPQAQTSYANMLVKGLGVEHDYLGAFKNFTAAAQSGSAGGMNGLGYIHLYGLGTKKDPEKAFYWFNQAAENGSVEAFYNLGALYISGIGVKSREYTRALKYFTLAVKKGHVLAMHKLAQMNLHGIGTTKSCESATRLFKYIAERSKATINVITKAKKAYRLNQIQKSLQLYLIGSELGSEIAQNNAAWLLDNGFKFDGRDDDSSHDVEATKSESEKSLIISILEMIFGPSISSLGKISGSKDALRLFMLSAEQDNHEARVKIGDYYYYAVGGIDTPDYKQAAHHYRVASDALNTQAMFNLGYMHEYGIGLPRDFHLAKRFYDRADETANEAHIPVNIALTQLWLHRFYRAVAYDDTVSGFPGFVISIINRLRAMRRYIYDETPIEEAKIASQERKSDLIEEINGVSRSKSEKAKGYLASRISDAGSLLLEEDMLLALFLSAVLAIVVYIRQARNLQ